MSGAPGSGVRVGPVNQRWELEDQEEVDCDAIYKECYEAHASLLSAINKYREKHGQPPVSSETPSNWNDVEESVSSACATMEGLTSKDKLPEGFIGKMRKAFRFACARADTAKAVVSLLDFDFMGSSAVCSGLKLVFGALERTGNHRKEVYRALAEIPEILDEHASLIHIHEKSEVLHRKAAAVYASLFRMLTHIVEWLLQGSFGPYSPSKPTL